MMRVNEEKKHQVQKYSDGPCYSQYTCGGRTKPADSAT